MEHNLLQRQHPSCQDHLMLTSGFYFSAAHFACDGGGGFTAPMVQPHDRGWEEDLWPLPLGGGADAFTAGNLQQPWHCDGGSSDGPPPAAAAVTSFDGHGDDGEQRVRELAASELNRDDDRNVAGSGTRKRRDRAKIIVSERKRRVRMQEKLYELRSLVPNITKMDKASIIGDAVEYVRKLQSHARKLKEEIAALEARQTSTGQDDNDDAGSTRSGGDRRGISHGALVAHVGATRVGDGRFLVTVECERRDGVAAPLCAAVESLACFQVESSSLGRSAPDRVVATFTLKVLLVATCQAESVTIGEGTVKLLVMAALGEEGFRPEATPGIS
ncbi:hypothetical protein EJB05_37409, partial [Eragrostis curvula]